MSGNVRSRLLDELSLVSRRYVSACALFHQALAERLGLHPTDVQCLNLLLLEREPVTTGRLAQLTGLTTGSATRSVDRLAAAGYVVRERDAADRRRVPVATVPERIAEFGRMWERLGGDWTPLSDDLADAELAVVVRHMRRTAEFGAEQVVQLREGRV